MINAEIVGVDRDQRLNIVIYVAFDQNETPIPFYSGGELITHNGQPVWPLICRYQNFIGKTRSQILQWISVNVRDQIKNIIVEKVKATINDQIENADLTSLVGRTLSESQITLNVDLDNDGTIDATVQLNDDGTYQVI